MAKDSDRLRGGVDLGETGGALSGLLAEEDEFDRRTLWRLGTWAAVSVGAVVVALVTNQSAIGWRREQTASADLLRQAQQIQLVARESQNETRRLASAVDTLNSDRDRLYSKVAVLEQGLDSVTGAITRQASTPSPPQAGSAASGTGQASASAASSAGPATPASPPASPPAPAQAPAASLAPVAAASPGPAPPTPLAPTASADPPPAAAKSSPAPVVAPVAATAPVVLEKQDKQASKPVASPEPNPTAVASLSTQQQVATPVSSAQPSGSLVASKSMIGPPDPAAGKLIEPTSPIPSSPPKTVTSAPLPEITIVSAKASEQAEPDPAPPAPVLIARRTEFGVDVGGANSVPGLRALWRGLLKSRSNVALTSLRPIIVIKENNNGLGMQLRLVAGPISDAAAAAKICASLTVSDRACSTTVFEGQRLVLNADEQAKLDSKPASEAKADKPVSEAKSEPDSKPASGSKFSGHHRYVSRHSPKEDDPPKPEPSTFSRLFSTNR